MILAGLVSTGNVLLPVLSDGSPHLGIRVADRLLVRVGFVTAHHLPLVAFGLAVRR